jgi:ferric-dicitrate binding protein FerR (iron transport regulator)
MLGAAGLAPLASDARAESAAGSVETLFGSAAASRGADSRGLSVGNALFVGDVVSTEALSGLAMRLGAATKIRLGALTLLRIDRYLVDMGGTLSLGEGAILFDRPADAPESMTIRGEFGLIAVRGTRFFAGPSQGRIGVFVDRGSVTVTSGGATVDLEAGEGTDVLRRGDPPTAPRRWSPDRIESALSLVR